MDARIHQHKRRRSRPSLSALILFVALLVFPSRASVRLAEFFDPRVICGYLVFISVVTLRLYWNDKRSAEVDGWRTPELTLHFAELLGGWPAAFLGQRIFRHKIRKISYQIAFGTIITLHETVSFDFLADWRYSKAALKFLLL